MKELYIDRINDTLALDVCALINQLVPFFFYSFWVS